MQARESGSPLLPKPIDQFRDYAHARPRVEEFYSLNHTHQTLGFVLEKKREYLALNRKTLTVWEALDFLNTLVDDSDPDIDFTQIEHAMQTAEAIRAANQPRWFIVTGLVHDLGKILCLFGEPQWAVVGDTFPVGCRWSPKIVFSNLFGDNPDGQVPEYQTEYGIYEPGCGLDRVHMSWGHDEYVYHVVKDYLPGRSALHAPLPLVLSVAQGRRVHAPHQRHRPQHAEVGARLQSLRPLFQGLAAARRAGAHAVLPGARRGVLPRSAALVVRPAFKAVIGSTHLESTSAPSRRATAEKIAAACAGTVLA